MWDIILNSLWLVIPAYCANFMPVFIRGKTPIDGKRNFSDGRRWFGDGKTYEGLIGGTIFGIIAGLVLILLQNAGFAGYAGISFEHTFLTIFMLSFFALLGDLVGSFFKRRLDMPRGAPAPILDQLDFLIFSLCSLSLFYRMPLDWVVFLVIVTPFIHKASNVFGYIIKLKKEPW
ncbi:MAG: CDP-2,3-bis-(O-geranylgeranyl)-sn-glycerol synthase [Candidatus Aenigmarchaeota archaeon]|nr:CDP-2,3-bis-(O-geranylgeranyl)-sn-glycerol synthase [Candidatus Aenigmarchaeota archaeon]